MYSKWKSAFLTLLMLAGSGCASSTHGPRDVVAMESRPDLPPFGSPQSIQYGKDNKAPYDADEYWPKVLALINLHDGYVAASELQEAFSTANLIRVRNIGENGYAASLVGKESWFGGFWYVRIWEPDRTGGQIMNALGGDFSSLTMLGIFDEHKQCLDPLKSANDLEALGWKRVPYQDALARTANNGPPPESFGAPAPIKMIKGKRSSVTLAYTDASAPRGTDHPGRACVAGIFVEGNK
jgi:hypothetical protein